MQIPISSGIYADTSPEFRTSYPVNMEAVPKVNGIGNGYLRPTSGVVQHGTGSGVCRGGIEWNDVCYRVMGQRLVRVNAAGAETVLGTIPGVDTVTMAYSFDRLAIAANGGLYYWDGSTLTTVTDPDLGRALSVLWVDGYFMTTDGEFLVVTELLDPTAVDPLKYGSSEVDPDPVVNIVKLRNEVYAVNRHTIEVFSNVGGAGFPFQRISGAQIMRGAVGTHAVAPFMEAIAFVGSGRNEQVGVFLGAGGGSTKISTREIDVLLNGYTPDQLANIRIEVQQGLSSSVLVIYAPDRTICFDAGASDAMGQPVWFYRSSGSGLQAWRATHLVWCYGKWLAADDRTAALGYLSDDVHSHWGAVVGWEFGTPIVYNGSTGVQFHELELVCLTGSAPFGANPHVSAEYSEDGVTWSMPRTVAAGKIGDRSRRLRWLRQGMMRSRRMYRFRGDSNAPLSVAVLEANLEPLAW